MSTAVHIRTGLHRATGETTKLIERSHVPTRDRLRASRGLKTLRTGQRFLEGFECLRALRGGHIRLADLLPAFSGTASAHDHVRTIAAAVLVLGMRLGRQPSVHVDGRGRWSRRSLGPPAESATGLYRLCADTPQRRKLPKRDMP